MFNLLDLIVKHFYNLTQWSNKLYDRFTIKRNWETTDGNTSEYASYSSEVSSFGNIVYIHLVNQKSSNFSTGNITNVQTSTIDAVNAPMQDVYEKLYFYNTSSTIQGGYFNSIRAFYCLSNTDGGLKSISCSAPDVSMSFSTDHLVGNITVVNYAFMFQPSVNAVQTADKYVNFRAITVGNMCSLNPYTLIRS